MSRPTGKRVKLNHMLCLPNTPGRSQTSIIHKPNQLWLHFGELIYKNSKYKQRSMREFSAFGRWRHKHNDQLTVKTIIAR